MNNRQSGAVLIVALMLLVVLTMLGISAIESTKLETRMAANTRRYNQAFQQAESGISKAFRTLEQNTQQLQEIGKSESAGFVDVIGVTGAQIMKGGEKNDLTSGQRCVFVYFIKSQGQQAAEKGNILVNLYAGMQQGAPKDEGKECRGGGGTPLDNAPPPPPKPPAPPSAGEGNLPLPSSSQ